MDFVERGESSYKDWISDVKAVQAFRRQQGGGKEKEFCAISAPATVEKVQLATGLNLQDLTLVAED